MDKVVGMKRLVCATLMCTGFTSLTQAQVPEFELVQPELFGAPESLTNAWADFDNDGDYDLFVGFRPGRANRMYRNDGGVFVDVAAAVGLADAENTRAAAWGDFNGDGHIDLYVGLAPPEERSNILYRNDGDGVFFTEVTADVNVELVTNTRQVSWVDFDNDGDLDLFVAVRNGPNHLYRNDAGSFTDVSRLMSVDDPRRTVGAVWFDFDKDGDLDLYVTNQNGDRNGLYRNDGAWFVDVAPELGADRGGRPLQYSYGGIRPCLADYDNDGDLDILSVNYGPTGLLRNDGGTAFVDVAEDLGLAIDSRYDTGTWGDFDHDGRLDVYINGTIGRDVTYRDYLFHNDGSSFTDVTPDIMLEQDSDHGAHWVDFDGDGDLDLSLTGAGADGMHHLLRNELSAELRTRSLQVMVLDERGYPTRAGTEVRLYASGTNSLLGTGILDTGSGYNSQNVLPVHFGLASSSEVDIEITSLTTNGRVATRLPGVDPAVNVGQTIKVKVNREGKIVP
jgi:hypothetical protein